MSSRTQNTILNKQTCSNSMSQVFKHQHVIKQTKIENDLSEIVSPLKVSLETKKTRLLWSWKTICLKDGNEQNDFDV
mgnify:CR=1 FL=1